MDSAGVGAMWLIATVSVLSFLFPCLHCAQMHGLEYNPSDFVVAQYSCVHRLPLTRVGRLWRDKGIRQFVALNDSKLVEHLNRDPESQAFNESYGYWEDDDREKGTWRGLNTGDTRGGMTPFMAHKQFGDTYKWMLYGDDDTLFFMTGVLRLLSSLDPNVPLAITDNLWYDSVHPGPGAPRCLPCSFNTSTIRSNASFIPRPGCPFCTRALACGTYSPAYRCRDKDMERMRTEYGPKLTDAVHDYVTAHVGSSAHGGSRGADSGGRQQRRQEHAEGWAQAMRRTSHEYDQWMRKHLSIHEQSQRRFKGHYSADWEMRDGPEAWAHRHQQFVNNTGLLAHVLGPRNSSAAEQWDELQLSHKFCAVHDTKLHTHPVRSCYQATGHGGVGIILSVGLMRAIDPDEAIAHILKQKPKGCGGSDCLFTQVLWKRMSIGFTDPGAALQFADAKYNRYTQFVESKHQMAHLTKLADPATPALEPSGYCDDECLWLNEYVLSAHVRARKTKNGRQVSEVQERMEGLLRAHAAAYDRILEARQDPAVAAGNQTAQSYIVQKYGKAKAQNNGR